jgi:Nitrile hydratase beta subunit
VDGVHDLGGMHGFGAIPIESDEPLFHEPWEGRVWAMWGAVASTIDRFRWTIEQMLPPEYLSSRYYERWLWALERLAAEQGLLEGEERPQRGSWPSPSEPVWAGRFRPGQRGGWSTRRPPRTPASRGTCACTRAWSNASRSPGPTLLGSRTHCRPRDLDF